jgi:hypothetical protein
MRTSFLFTRVYALAYAYCGRTNCIGFTSLFGDISGRHASTVRAAGACC